MSGLVTVEVVVDETGKVISAVATGGPAILREVAVQAALERVSLPPSFPGNQLKFQV